MYTLSWFCLDLTDGSLLHTHENTTSPSTASNHMPKINERRNRSYYRTRWDMCWSNNMTRILANICPGEFSPWEFLSQGVHVWRVYFGGRGGHIQRILIRVVGWYPVTNVKISILCMTSLYVRREMELGQAGLASSNCLSRGKEVWTNVVSPLPPIIIYHLTLNWQFSHPKCDTVNLIYWLFSCNTARKPLNKIIVF